MATNVATIAATGVMSSINEIRGVRVLVEQLDINLTREIRSVAELISVVDDRTETHPKRVRKLEEDVGVIKRIIKAKNV